MRSPSLLLVCALASATATAEDAKALRETREYYDTPLEQLLDLDLPAKAEVGSRSGARDALEAEVPIDVITAAELETSGYTELGKALAKLLPGFNFPRPTLTDGTDHARPFTLRGLNPDQVLVLVNGKRQHQSSLLNVNGSVGRGTSGVDINTIPIGAVDRVEVLRDGAAAQYGSDAIAGIVNIVLKGYGYASRASATYGATADGDGRVRDLEVFHSIPLRGDGFVNLTAELSDRGPTNRAGGDARFDGRINHRLGDADLQDGLLALNVEVPGDTFTTYGHGTFDRRDGEAGALYRLPDDPRNNPQIYPDGFLPMIGTKITDYSLSVGVKGVTRANLNWDLSYTRGYNDFRFLVDNSLNDSLGAATPTHFDSGATRYLQNILNLGLSQQLGQLNLAGGAEYREEQYRILSGEPASYALGEASPFAGAQGFPGFQPHNEVDAERHNLALFVDAKYAFSRDLMLETAARYEDYSDFGDNLDVKGAFRYRAHPDLMLRGSASTGFRAPSLSQSYYTATVSAQYITDQIVQAGTFGVHHPVSVALGATPLKPERSKHQTLGLVYQPSVDFTFSADFFRTDIDDRIMITGNITGAISPEVGAILDRYGVQYARYFTNAIATRTEGVDLRLEYKRTLGDGAKLRLGSGYHRDRTRITRIYPLASILGDQTQAAVINAATRSWTEDAQPQDMFKLWTQYERGPYRATANLNRFGEFAFVDTRFGAKWTLDLDLAYQLSDAVQIALGGENVFDAMPDKWGITGYAFTSGDGVMQYPQSSPFGYNGAYYYGRIRVSF